MFRDKEVFLALDRSGLLGKANDNENFVDWLSVNWENLLRLAEEQSAVGSVTAGVDRLPSGTLPLTEKLTLLDKCQSCSLRKASKRPFAGI